VLEAILEAILEAVLEAVYFKFFFCARENYHHQGVKFIKKKKKANFIKNKLRIKRNTKYVLEM
jgi:hypothetical protein